MTFMYMLDGSVKTMQSVWSGPPGQLLRDYVFIHQPKLNLTMVK